MKGLIKALSLLMALTMLAGCGSGKGKAEPNENAHLADPVVFEESYLDGVIAFSYWEANQKYTVQHDNEGFSEILTVLSKLHGYPCDRPDAAGTSMFELSLKDGRSIDFNVISFGEQVRYSFFRTKWIYHICVCEDGIWYELNSTERIDEELIKLCKEYSAPASSVDAEA